MFPASDVGANSADSKHSNNGSSLQHLPQISFKTSQGKKKKESSARITLLFEKENKDKVAKRKKGSKQPKNRVIIGLRQTTVNVDHPGRCPPCWNDKAMQRVLGRAGPGSSCARSQCPTSVYFSSTPCGSKHLVALSLRSPQLMTSMLALHSGPDSDFVHWPTDIPGV